MMIEPPIDKMIKKTECRYVLACGITKRSKEILAMGENSYNDPNIKAISAASKEIYEGKYRIIREK